MAINYQLRLYCQHHHQLRTEETGEIDGGKEDEFIKALSVGVSFKEVSKMKASSIDAVIIVFLSE